MPPLSKNAGPLLRKVAGKQHATDADHAETANANVLRSHESSSDEAAFRSIPSPPLPEPISKPPNSMPEPSQRAGKKRKRTEMIPPPKRTAHVARVAREGREYRQGGQENAKAFSLLADLKTVEPQQISNEDLFGFQYGGSRKKPQTTFASSTNIHARPKKAGGYSSRAIEAHTAPLKPSATKKLTKPKTFSKRDKLPDTIDKEDDDALSEVSMKDVVVTPPKLKTTKSPRKKLEATKKVLNPPVSLFDELQSAGYKKGEPTSSAGSVSLAGSRNRRRHPKMDTGHASAPESYAASEDRHVSSVNSQASSPLSTDSSDGLVPPEDQADDFQQYLATIEDEDADGSTCPLCHESVDNDHLRKFKYEYPKMTIREQGLFCRQHQKRKAQDEYRKLGYPDIDWGTFDRQCRKHWPRIKAVLNDTARPSSYWRQQHEDAVAKGEDRTMIGSYFRKRADSEEAEEGQEGTDLAARSGSTSIGTTGYYGLRGARAMMEAITKEFADLIRQRMVSDKVVAFGGIGNFVQRVLVPELSTLLVMEHMGVSEARAREVLEESAEIGEVVNEELEDEVGVDDEEED